MSIDIETTDEDRLVVILDGYVVDDETGEVYGLHKDCDLRYDPISGEYHARPSAPPILPFRVTDDESADWVLGLKFDAESAIKSLEARKAAMVANFDRMTQPYRVRLRYLEYRFDRELEQHAAANLPKGRKSLSLPHGTIAFRTVPATFNIVDPDAAVAWAETYAPEIVTKSVTKTAVAKHLDPDSDLPPFAEPVPERQSCSIKTGLI